MADFTYTCETLGGAAVADIAPDFESLTPSAYADGSYRLRRYSAFDVDRASGTIVLQQNRAFVQSSDVNRHQGDVARRYDDLLESTYASPGFAEAMLHFAAIADLPQRVPVEVHQMRIIARDGGDAPATPEGVHQDGFDRIAVVCAGRRNAEGGDLNLHPARDAEPMTTVPMTAGALAVLNDAELFHSAQPVHPVDGSEPATLDLFVFTANRA